MSGAAYPFDPDVNNQDLFQSQKIGMAIMTSFAASAWPPRSPSCLIRSRWRSFRTRSAQPASTPARCRRTARACRWPARTPDKAWIVLSRLYTGQRHGIERFGNGLGSPGSRNDVWGSDEFNKIAPKLANIAKVMVLPPGPELLPWHHPANGRYAEHEPILINEFNKVTLGQLDVDQFADDTNKQMQDILDKPNV